MTGFEQPANYTREGAGELPAEEAQKRASWIEIPTPGFKLSGAGRYYDPVQGRMLAAYDEVYESDGWVDAHGLAQLNMSSMEWTLLPRMGLTDSDIRTIAALSDGTIAVSQTVFQLPCPASGTTNGALFRLSPGADAWEDISRDRYCNSRCFAQGEQTQCSQRDRYYGNVAVRAPDRDRLYVESNELFSWSEAQDDWVSETGDSIPYGSNSYVGDSFFMVIGGRMLRQDSASLTVYSHASNYSAF